MPQGLQIWDASGNLVLDTSTFVLKEIYAANVASNATGDLTIPSGMGEVIGVNTETIPIDDFETEYNSSVNKLYYRSNNPSTDVKTLRVLAL